MEKAKLYPVLITGLAPPFESSELSKWMSKKGEIDHTFIKDNEALVYFKTESDQKASLELDGEIPDFSSQSKVHIVIPTESDLSTIKFFLVC